MTAVAARVAGPSIPAGRIFGSGTCLDSSRLQSLLAQKLEIDAQSVTGYVVGEHGDSSVALWSTVRVFCVFWGGGYILCLVYICVCLLCTFSNVHLCDCFSPFGGVCLFSFSHFSKYCLSFFPFFFWLPFFVGV